MLPSIDAFTIQFVLGLIALAFFLAIGWGFGLFVIGAFTGWLNARRG